MGLPHFKKMQRSQGHKYDNTWINEWLIKEWNHIRYQTTWNFSPIWGHYWRSDIFSTQHCRRMSSEWMKRMCHCQVLTHFKECGLSGTRRPRSNPNANTSLNCSVQFSSVTQSCPTPCDFMDHSTPGLPVHHQLPKSTQTHVHWADDAIQPSNPLLSPSLPASVFPIIRVFSNESALPIRCPKDWSFSFSISPSNEQDWSPLG